jgi:hypothetical protein
MKFFFRYKPDGTKGLSYFSYLGIVMTASLSIYLLRTRPRASVGKSTKPRGAQVTPITQQASLVEPVKVDNVRVSKKQDSFRLPAEVDTKRSEVKLTKNDVLSPLAYALQDLDSASDVLKDSKYPELLPAYAQEKPKSLTNPIKQEVGDIDLKLSYYDSEMVSKLESIDKRKSNDPPTPVTDYIPKGSLLEVCLLSTVDTSNPTALIECALVHDFHFNHISSLRFGIRFLGKLSGVPARGRINVLFDTIVTPSGKQIAINASVVEQDKLTLDCRPGLTAKLISPPLWVEASPYLAQVFTGFLNYFKTQVNNPVIVSTSGISFQQSAAAEFKSAGSQATASALEDLSLTKQRQWNEMYGAYYLVPSGTLCNLQLLTELDVSKLSSL